MESHKDVGKVDFVFASEYFEHIENAVEHLTDIIDTCNPKYLIIANSFNTISIGHFNEYLHSGLKIPAKNMSKLFNLTLKKRGYIKVKTSFWNNRPSFFVRNDCITW